MGDGDESYYVKHQDGGRVLGNQPTDNGDRTTVYIPPDEEFTIQVNEDQSSNPGSGNDSSGWHLGILLNESEQTVPYQGLDLIPKHAMHYGLPVDRHPVDSYLDSSEHHPLKIGPGILNLLSSAYFALERPVVEGRGIGRLIRKAVDSSLVRSFAQGELDYLVDLLNTGNAAAELLEVYSNSEEIPEGEREQVIEALEHFNETKPENINLAGADRDRRAYRMGERLAGTLVEYNFH